MITNLADFYRSGAWKSFVNILALEREDEQGTILCAHCGKPIVKAYDRIAHHKIHLTLGNVNDVNIALNPDNIDLVHHSCHNAIHNRFGFAVKKVYLVHGSPCSGKSTFVSNVAGPGDLVLDLDAVWACISGGGAIAGNDGHLVRDDRLKSNVFRVRDCILDMIKTRHGDWCNAYIIGGYPRIMERERMATIYGAEMIHIDTPREICEERAAQRPIEWAGFVQNYWDTFQE